MFQGSRIAQNRILVSVWDLSWDLVISQSVSKWIVATIRPSPFVCALAPPTTLQTQSLPTSTPWPPYSIYLPLNTPPLTSLTPPQLDPHNFSGMTHLKHLNGVLASFVEITGGLVIALFTTFFLRRPFQIHFEKTRWFSVLIHIWWYEYIILTVVQ